MLSPRQSATRERSSLDGLWRFALDARGVGRTERWWTSALAGDGEMPVPASFNDILPTRDARDHVGDVWYQRTVRVPRGWDGQRIVLRFDAATHRATAWVGDVQVAEHEGGYTPFEADVTEHVRAGEEVRVTVVVNNELSWTSIPPGYVQEFEDGGRVQPYFHDFFNYAGLHRSVWLHTTPEAYVSDVSVSTQEIDGTAGVINYRAVVANAEDHQVRVTVRDSGGEAVTQASGPEGTIRMADVRLWQPGAGYLYTLDVEVLSPDGVVDIFHQPFGVRTVTVDGHRFLINGEPFYFTGFGKHEDFAIHGRGFDPAVMVADFALLEWLGGEPFPGAHYSHDKAVLA